MLGPVSRGGKSGVHPKSSGAPGKDFKQGGDEPGTFGNVPCDSTGETVGSRQSGFRFRHLGQ